VNGSDPGLVAERNCASGSGRPYGRRPSGGRALGLAQLGTTDLADYAHLVWGLVEATSAVTVYGDNLPAMTLSVDKSPVPGVMQINVPIPIGQDCDTQVVVQVGNVKSQPGVTIAIGLCI